MKTACDEVGAALQLMGFLTLDGAISRDSVEAALRSMYPVLLGGKKQVYGNPSVSAGQGVSSESRLPLGVILLELNGWLDSAASPISGQKIGYRYWLKIFVLLSQANEKVRKSGNEYRFFPYKDSSGKWGYIVGKVKLGTDTIQESAHVDEAKLEAALTAL